MHSCHAERLKILISFGKTLSEIRFSRSVKYLATIEYLIQNIIHMGMVIYLPAVAVETATNIDRWVGVWLTGAVCIFYTSLGGLKVSTKSTNNV